MQLASVSPQDPTITTFNWNERIPGLEFWIL
jgi:hypothetical protein